MRPIDDQPILTPDERRDELAGIFAAGILRLHARSALPNESQQISTPVVPEDSGLLRLEVSPETVLSVHNG
jgi:hypothetical protein